MPWLVVDTALPRAVVAVVDVFGDLSSEQGTTDVVVRAEHFLDDSRRHAEAIADCAADVVRAAGLTMAGLDGVGVGCGPGSFIGVRTGLSFALGLGRGAGIPVVGVSGVVAMAGSVDAGVVKAGANVGVVIDAKRGERYVAVVRVLDDGSFAFDDVRALAPADVAAAVVGASVIVGVVDDVIDDGADVAVVAVAGPTGRGMAVALRAALRAGALAQPAVGAAPVPVYVRGADAKVPAVDPAARRAAVLAALDDDDDAQRGDPR
jgi:tRNA threonylcarbamoyladenosine biosynthesis protein TsaB